MSVTPATLAALVIAISFAAGLNVYATILTLGGMARLHWVELPSGLDALSSWWVIGASAVLFAAEFVADKIPGFDLLWNAAHTFVRIPVALLLAYGATTHLTPEMQMLVTVLGGAIATVTHGSKLAVRGAATASPEPFSNIALSATEDTVAVGLTWAATQHPLIAGSVAAAAVMAALLMMRLAVRAIGRLWIRLSRRSHATVALLVCVAWAIGANAQMLARPGWNRSSVAVQSLAKHAVIYEIDARSFADSNGDGVGDLKGITQHLDYVQTLGADAILLDSLLPPAGGSAGLASPIDPALGTVDDFDELSMQASRRNIRILLDLPQPDGGMARFWLTRGIGGFHISSGGQANAEAMQAMRKLLNTNMGQRELITDADLSAIPKLSPHELLLDSALLKLPIAGTGVAGQVRKAMEESQAKMLGGNALLVSDANGLPRGVNRFSGGADSPAEREGLARILGAILLLNRSASLLYAGQELALASPDGKSVLMPWAPPPQAAGLTPPSSPKPAQPAYPGQYVPYVAPPPPVKPIAPDPASAAGQALNPGSVLSFYGKLIRLHRGSGPLRDGEQIVLNHDDQNVLVWVRKPATPTYQNPAVFVVCNLSDKPLVLSLKSDIARLHLRGTFLRTVVRSDEATGSMPVETINMPPFGVYAGELKY